MKKRCGEILRGPGVVVLVDLLGLDSIRRLDIGNLKLIFKAVS